MGKIWVCMGEADLFTVGVRVDAVDKLLQAPVSQLCAYLLRLTFRPDTYLLAGLGNWP